MARVLELVDDVQDHPLLGAWQTEALARYGARRLVPKYGQGLPVEYRWFPYPIQEVPRLDAEDAGYALSTRRHIHVTLGKALKQAVKWHYLATSPAAGAEVPQADAALLDYEDLPDPEMGVLEEWQARRFLATAKERDPRHWALYVLALATGMRQDAPRPYAPPRQGASDPRPGEGRVRVRPSED
jgi:hypothetical protein